MIIIKKQNKKLDKNNQIQILMKCQKHKEINKNQMLLLLYKKHQMKYYKKKHY